MSIEDKQQLLVTEIYNKGYDLEDFTRYMDTKKENGGEDIDIWTMQELKDAIYTYQQEQNGKTNKQSFTQMQQYEDSDDLFQKEIQCQEVIQTQLGITDNVKILIECFEKIDTGFFSLSQSYVNYKIVTSPFDWCVTRRYSDFEWLREILCKQYPGVFVPPIANKTHTRQFSDAYLGKRLKFLDKFLNHILHSNILKNDKYFQDFISMKDEKEFKNVQKQAEKLPKTTKLEKVVSMDGKLHLAINGQTNNYFKQINTLFNNFNISYEQIMKGSKKLLTDFEVISTSLLQLGENFEVFTNHINQFNKNVAENEKNIKLEAVTITLNNMMVIWGKNMGDFVNHIQENFRNFFKFHDKEITQMKEFMKLRDVSQQEYLKYKERLDLKKDKLYQLKEYNKWDCSKETMANLENQNQMNNKKMCMAVMLPKETSQQNDLRDTFAYYNNSIYSEVQRILNHNVEIYSSHFINFANIQTENLTKMHVTWADIKGNLEGLDDLINDENRKLMVMPKQQQIVT